MMRYFVMADNPDRGEVEPAAILRLEDGAPWALAESARIDGTWQRTDSLERYHLLGSTDRPITEIDAARARQILIAQRERSGGRRILPDPLPGEPGAETPHRTEAELAERAARAATARQLEDKINRRWAEVPIPPGAADIAFPTTRRDKPSDRT
jgi:hypothetical protein